MWKTSLYEEVAVVMLPNVKLMLRLTGQGGFYITDMTGQDDVVEKVKKEYDLQINVTRLKLSVVLCAVDFDSLGTSKSLRCC